MPSFPSRTAPGSGGAAVLPSLDVLLRKADARIIGTDTCTDTAGTLALAIPTPGAAATTLATMTTTLLWDLGITAAELASLQLQMAFSVMPSGDNVRLCTGLGVLYSASALESVALATDPSHWTAGYAGNGVSTPGTTVGYAGRSGNADPRFASGSQASATALHLVTAHLLQGTSYKALTAASVSSSAGTGRELNTNQDVRSADHRVFVFASLGRGATGLETVTPEVQVSVSYGRRSAA